LADPREKSNHYTGMAKVAVQSSAETFVVKVPNFAKPENDIYMKQKSALKLNLLYLSLTLVLH
jgi:hypothetical protein